MWIVCLPHHKNSIEFFLDHYKTKFEKTIEHDLFAEQASSTLSATTTKKHFDEIFQRNEEAIFTSKTFQSSCFYLWDCHRRKVEGTDKSKSSSTFPRLLLMRLRCCCCLSSSFFASSSTMHSMLVCVCVSVFTIDG